MNDKSTTLISFIIPAHNAATTLKECVNSIVTNNNADIEVLIVENGSSDTTTEIADSLCNMDSRVKVFHSDKGVSNARNKGIRVATGRWIVFVDADDFIIDGQMDKVIADADKSDADLILYGYCVGKDYRKIYNGNQEKIYVGKEIEDIRVKMLKNPTRYMQVWAKLFRSEVIKSNKVNFDNRLRLSEDSDFILRYTRFCKKIVLSAESIYRYILNPTSTMRLVDGEKAKDYEFAMRITAQAIEKESKRIQDTLHQYILMHLNILMVREIYNIENTNSYLKKYAQMRELLDKTIFKKAIISTKIKECRNLRMLPVLLLKFKMDHLASIVFIVRAEQNYKREKEYFRGR